MHNYELVLLTQFIKHAADLQEKYPRADEAIAIAKTFLCDKAEECGYSTRSELRYFPTRSFLNSTPPFLIFFHIEQKKVNLVDITEYPQEGSDENENES